MISQMDLTYSPELSVHKNPVNTLGMIAKNIFDNLTMPVNIKEVNNENFFILDIRNRKEYEKAHIENAKWIPINELRSKLTEIPKDKNIYIYDNTGLRAYIAERILKGNDFANVYNIDGGISFIKLFENMF